MDVALRGVRGCRPPWRLAVGGAAERGLGVGALRGVLVSWWTHLALRGLVRGSDRGSFAGFAGFGVKCGSEIRSQSLQKPLENFSNKISGPELANILGPTQNCCSQLASHLVLLLRPDLRSDSSAGEMTEDRADCTRAAY